MEEVIEKLLTVGISDPDPNIRITIFTQLDGRFDPQISVSDDIDSLFMAVNDEVFAVRDLAVRTIGRLACHNPSHVMPCLRKAIIQLLTELEYSATR